MTRINIFNKWIDPIGHDYYSGQVWVKLIQIVSSIWHNMNPTREHELPPLLYDNLVIQSVIHYNKSLTELCDGLGLFVKLAKYLSPAFYDIDKFGIMVDM